MKKSTRTAVAWSASIVATTCLVAACAGESLGSASGSGAKDTVKVGVLVAQSGVYAAVGKDMAAGVELYLEQHDDRLAGREVDGVTVDEGETDRHG